MGEGVKAEITDMILHYMMPKTQRSPEVLKITNYFDQLEDKAQELDRRELGVATVVSYDGFTCSRCGAIEEYKFKYCPNCGHRLI